MKQFHDAKVFNTRLPSLVIPLAHETIIKARIKDTGNMEDLMSTARTFKPPVASVMVIIKGH